MLPPGERRYTKVIADRRLLYTVDLHELSEKIAKIGPADAEIIVLRAIIKKIRKEKKKEINASKIYSPSSKLAERTKCYVPLRNYSLAHCHNHHHYLLH